MLLLIFVMALAGSTVYAQTDIGFKGVGGKIGLVDPEGGGGATFGLGAFADLGAIASKIHLEGNLDFWSKSFSGGGVKSSFRDIAIGGTVKYFFPLSNPSLRPFAGGGLALHFLNVDIDIPEVNIGGTTFGGSSSSTTTKIGFNIAGGVFYKMNEKVDLLAEFKYRIVSNFNQINLKIGALFYLGQ